MKKHIILVALAACGGSQKTLSHDNVPPPATIKKTEAKNEKTAESQQVTAKVEVSKDAKADYSQALAYFNDNDKGGWNESACRSAADKFDSVSRSHPELVQAAFMVGLSYERCGMLQDAEKALQSASHMKGNDAAAAMALSELGTVYWRAGKPDGAKQYWDAALKANPKLSGAHINTATVELDQIRRINNPKDSKWKELEADARWHLSNALGVDSDSEEAYTVFGLVYLEGWQANKNRLDLAKLMLEEAKKRNEKYAPMQNAWGLFYMHKNQLNQALSAFQAAVDLDPKFVEARINAGEINLGFRKYDVAKALFEKAVELAPKNYEAMVGLGFAQRGMNDLDNAEATYKKAIAIDSRKLDAYYNLGVLYKGFRATHEKDIPASIQDYKKAKDFFQQALDKDGDPKDKTEAKNNMNDCDKNVKQLEDYQKAAALAAEQQKQFEQKVKDQQQQQQQQQPAPQQPEQPPAK